jgi:tetratricopeptide (TPR) repeat protein
MRRLLSWSLVLAACCLLLAPVAGCGSKKGPATIADLLAKARKNPKPEGRARDLARVAGMQIKAKDTAGAARTLEAALAEIPAEGQPLICVPVLVEIAQTYAEIDQRSSAKKAAGKAETMAAALTDPQGKADMLAQVGVAKAAAGDKDGAKQTLGDAAALALNDVPERFRGKALAAVAMGYVDAGLADAAQEVIGTLEELAGGLEELRPKAEAFAAAAAVRAATNDKANATKLLAQAAESAKAIDDFPVNRVYALVAVAKALVANGDTKGATALLADAEKSASKIPDPQMQKDALKAVRVLMAKLGG